jgi:hypothetical protein
MRFRPANIKVIKRRDSCVDRDLRRFPRAGKKTRKRRWLTGRFISVFGGGQNPVASDVRGVLLCSSQLGVDMVKKIFHGAFTMLEDGYGEAEVDCLSDRI